jgi:hypothetical protein
MRLKATYEQRRAFQQAMSSMLKSIPEGGFSAESLLTTDPKLVRDYTQTASGT